MEVKEGNIIIENLSLPYTNKVLHLKFKRGLNYLRGNNGTGKTLLLDYVSGIRKDTKANIYGNESVIYINQSTFFSDRLTCKDFLEFIYRMEGRIGEISDFELFVEGFEHKSWIHTDVFLLLKKQWGKLSGGERKFIYILILMSIDREWYILDEPFAFLDSIKKDIIWKIINYRLSEGKGVILTSHEDETKRVQVAADVMDITEF